MTVLCVVGPTASGKTKMAVALARRLNGEVVSVDSMQIYRGMTIGTAAPTAEEMEGVPHHMIAVADPAEQWSAARFCQAADFKYRAHALFPEAMPPVSPITIINLRPCFHLKNFKIHRLI